MTDQQPIVARYRFVVEELLQAHRWHARHAIRKRLWIFYSILVSAIVFLGVLTFLNRSGDQPNIDGALGGSIGLACLIPILRLIVVPWVLRRRFKRSPYCNIEIEMTLSSQGLTLKNPHSQTQTEWPGIYKVVSTPDGLMLYTQEATFHWLPRYAFAPRDFERAVELVKMYVPRFFAVGAHSSS